MMDSTLSRAGSLTVTALTVMVAVLLALALFSVTSASPGHRELHQRQEMMEQQLQYISCLLLIDGERTPEAVASCQVTPSD